MTQDTTAGCPCIHSSTSVSSHTLSLLNFWQDGQLGGTDWPTWAGGLEVRHVHGVNGNEPGRRGLWLRSFPAEETASGKEGRGRGTPEELKKGFEAGEVREEDLVVS